jgi:cysteine desulfurase
MMPLYLDHHATTPVDPAVREALLPWLGEKFGNAGSKSHAYGWQAAEAVDRARAQVARMLRAEAREIVLTAGATESNNLAILGTARGRREGRVVTTAVEHHAVLDTCASLSAQGIEVVVLPVDRHGRVDPRDVALAVDERTFLVSVMAANNEVGTIQPVEEIGRICKERGALFHCDAAQAIGRMPVDVGAWGADLLALSGHKFYAPQGVGALYVRSRRPHVRLQPLMHGGGQEGGLRPGTTNVPGAVALGAASELVGEHVAGESARIAGLRDRLQARLAALPGAHVNGHPEHRLCGNLSIRFDGVDSEALILAAPRLAFSAGAACATGDRAPSAVLLAMGLSPEQARSTIRLGLGRITTEADVDVAGDLLTEAVTRLREGRSAAGRG